VAHASDEQGAAQQEPTQLDGDAGACFAVWCQAVPTTTDRLIMRVCACLLLMSLPTAQHSSSSSRAWPHRVQRPAWPAARLPQPAEPGV
jgi:hypothetical protein